MTMMTTTTMTPRETIFQTGPSLGDDTADLAISILRADKGSYMSRLPLGFALAVLRTLSRLLSVSTITDEDGMCGGGGGEVGNTTGSACSMMTARTRNTTTTTNTTTRRMGRIPAGERMMGGNLTSTVATSSAGRPSGAWGGGH